MVRKSEGLIRRLRSRRSGNQEPTVTWLTNIPTPYRHHRFHALHLALDERDCALRVLYMGETEPQRPWAYDAAEARYPHRVLPGLSLSLAGRPLHFNPSVVVEALRRPAVMVIGGVSNPTAWMAMAARNRQRFTLLGVESNLESERLGAGPASWIKNWMVRTADGYCVPGNASIGYLSRHDERAISRPILRLANIIDEAQFPLRTSVDSSAARNKVRADWGASDDTVVVLVPARLEPYKGVGDVAAALEAMEEPGRLLLVLAGSGSLEEELRRRLSNSPARVIGQIPDGEMAQLYAAADVMMLPSRRDPSPLSVVEALRSGLPLVLSAAVGNAPEALVSGENGWLVPPRRPDLLTAVLTEIADTPVERLREFGRRSERIHRERFSTEFIIGRAADQLAALAQAGRS
jgi:glycosyltransferase involved in cell wall biosynthesis